MSVVRNTEARTTNSRKKCNKCREGVYLRHPKPNTGAIPTIEDERLSSSASGEITSYVKERHENNQSSQSQSDPATEQYPLVLKR